MQPDAKIIHRQKRHAQHQRNRDADDETRTNVDVVAPPQRQPARPLVRAFVKTEGDEAHGQHDQHGFNQHADKFIDRSRHCLGLVLHVNQPYAGRQCLANSCGQRFKRLAQRNDVAAFDHRHTQRNHFLALMVYFHPRRVRVAALDFCNITEPQLTTRRAGAGAVARTTNRHGTQLLNRLKLPLYAHLQDIQRRLNSTGRFNSVLLAQLRQYLIEIKPELRQALLRDLDEDFFVLHAKQLDLADERHAKQLLAHIVGKGLHLRVVEAV